MINYGLDAFFMSPEQRGEEINEKQLTKVVETRFDIGLRIK